MGTKLAIDVTEHTTASPVTVWKLLADVETWKDWGPWGTAELERTGAPEPGGVGALRRFEYRGRITREEVVAFEPPGRFAYELRSGLPVRNYHSEVTVVPDGTGARLEWHSRFERTFTGRLLRPMLARFIGDVARRLLRAAEAS